MIPKIVHYCWLSGDPVPKMMQRCMETWKMHLPDFEFILWDLKRFDIGSSVWAREAFEHGKYAFAADYIRLYALEKMGGIYLDMDVEMLKPFDDLLDREYFIGYENNRFRVPEMAVFGVEPGCPWVSALLEHYRDRHFVQADGSMDTKPLPHVAKEVLAAKGITLDLLPSEYLSPKPFVHKKFETTNNTYCIHQFADCWIPWEQRVERRFWDWLGVTPHRFMLHFDNFLLRVFHIKR